VGPKTPYHTPREAVPVKVLPDAPLSREDPLSHFAVSLITANVLGGRLGFTL